MEKDFNLYNLSDQELDRLLSMNEFDLDNYIKLLIQRFYKFTITNDDTIMYTNISKAYKSSFLAEKLYRTHVGFYSGFQAVYTKTGIISNIINDMYFTEDHFITH